jgi:two-component system, cell cycle response regulator CpdR
MVTFKDGGTGLKNLSSTTSNKKIRILVVDDEPDILLGLSWLLERLGHYVKTFDNPAQALEHIVSGDVHYDLVITDYRMPGGISGLDLAKRVKKHKRGKKAKVFLMSAFDIMSLPELNEPDLNEAAKSEIVDEIIQKPIRNDKLIAIIESNFLYSNRLNPNTGNRSEDLVSSL